jgi:hypothetical protein
LILNLFLENKPFSHIQNKIVRDKLQFRIDEELDKRQALIPVLNGYIEGPAMRDERRNKATMNQREATQEWARYFGGKKETRWDNFEDYLYLMCETYLSNYLDLIKHVHWERLFVNIYKKHALDCVNNEVIKELPEIPFVKA